MNCKPDDLAMVVRNVRGTACDGNLIGTPIRVTSLFESHVGPAWLYSGEMLRCPGCGNQIFAFLDANLQPLRGPCQSSASMVSEPIEGLTVIEESVT